MGALLIDTVFSFYFPFSSLSFFEFGRRARAFPSSFVSDDNQRRGPPRFLFFSLPPIPSRPLVCVSFVALDGIYFLHGSSSCLLRFFFFSVSRPVVTLLMLVCARCVPEPPFRTSSPSFLFTLLFSLFFPSLVWLSIERRNTPRLFPCPVFPFVYLSGCPPLGAQLSLSADQQEITS